VTAKERCVVVQLVDARGRTLGPVRVRRERDGVRQEEEERQPLDTIGCRLRRDGWKLVAGDRVPVRAQHRGDRAYALILTYTRDG